MPKTELGQHIQETFSKPMDIARIKQAVNRREDVTYYAQCCRELREAARKTVSCAICGQRNTKRSVQAKIFGLEYIECARCRHIYIDLLPSWQEYFEMENKVSKRMNRNLYENKSVNMYRVENIAGPKVEYVLRQYPDCENGLWVDVGCGTGEVLVCARQKGFDVLGVDTNESSRAFAQKEYDIRVVPPDRLDDQVLEKAAVVSVFNVLEHMAEPGQFLEQMVHLTPAQTVFVIEVPHYHSLSSEAQKTYPDYVNRHLIPCSHFQLFTEPSLKFLLNQKGLEITHQWWFGQDVYEMIQLMSLSDEKFRLSPLCELLMRNLNELQGVVDQKRQSDSLFVLAQKMNQ